MSFVSCHSSMLNLQTQIEFSCTNKSLMIRSWSSLKLSSWIHYHSSSMHISIYIILLCALFHIKTRAVCGHHDHLQTGGVRVLPAGGEEGGDGDEGHEWHAQPPRHDDRGRDGERNGGLQVRAVSEKFHSLARKDSYIKWISHLLQVAGDRPQGRHHLPRGSPQGDEEARWVQQ